MPLGTTTKHTAGNEFTLSCPLSLRDLKIKHGTATCDSLAIREREFRENKDPQDALSLSQ